ncbi:MAG: OmpH family outer membrane protein [Candidatus Omnitrophica bacterium]|nr:OmpH family outer membrane protein [Candidatus Omnitrophota bacterium]
MKGRLALIGVVIFISAVFVAAVQGNLYAKEYKIGYVDLAKVFDEYAKTKESEKALEEKGKTKEAERKKITDEVRKLKDEQALLSEKAKAEKQKVIDDKIKTLQEFDKNTRDELIKERNDAIGGIMKDIEKVVADYSKEANYDLILNSRTLLYGTQELELTEEILKRLNKK